MDHYFDHMPTLISATKTRDSATIRVFAQARVLLISSAVVLVTALLCSPVFTWVMVGLFFGPAFIWDFNLLWLRGTPKPKFVDKGKSKQSENDAKFSVKRIPGIKALLVGVIRGYVAELLGEMHCFIRWDSQLRHIRNCLLRIRTRHCHRRIENDEPFPVVRQANSSLVHSEPCMPLGASPFTRRILPSVQHLPINRSWQMCATSTRIARSASRRCLCCSDLSTERGSC